MQKEIEELGEPIAMREEDWMITEDEIKIPKTVLFGNISKNKVDLNEEEALEFFKSIDLNYEEIDKM